MFKAMWPPAAALVAALCLVAATINYLHRDDAKQPAAAPERITPMLHHKQPLPYRYDDGRQAPAEAALTGKLHHTGYTSARPVRPAYAELRGPHPVARYGAPASPQWVYHHPPSPQLVYYYAAPQQPQHYRRGAIRRFFCRR
jgi:hypothetical protein